jgi:hypothetical protein
MKARAEGSRNVGKQKTQPKSNSDENTKTRRQLCDDDNNTKQQETRNNKPACINSPL